MSFSSRMTRKRSHVSNGTCLCSRMLMLLMFSLECSDNPLVVARSVQFVLRIEDPKRAVLLDEIDPMRFTDAPSLIPSAAPSSLPSLHPTSMPSSTPSSAPSLTPSLNPTAAPSSDPSSAPSLMPSLEPTDLPSVSSAPSLVPSEGPSDVPTVVPSESPSENPSSVPSKYEPEYSAVYGEEGYFNYNPGDSKYGPSAWGQVQKSSEFKYWSKWPQEVWEFQLHNQCDRNWRPSPIDVCDGVGFADDYDYDFDVNTTKPMNNVNTPCFEYHRIHGLEGDWEIDDETRIQMHILPSKLRMTYSLRDCPYQDEFGIKGGGSPVWFPLPPDKGGKYKWCDWEPPAADFPNHWNGFVQPIHIDIKIPSEHTICGRQFDGELTVWHIHPQRRAALAMSSLITIGKHNKELQKALDQWQVKYDEEENLCSLKRNRQLKERKTFLRRMDNFLQYGVDVEDFTPQLNSMEGNDFNSYFDLVEDEQIHLLGKQKQNRRRERELSRKNKFNPYHPEIYKSVWFYGYWGTMTEPPCSDRWINWIIMDAPFEISPKQYEQIKKLLLTHRNSDCVKTSVAFKGRVNRPTQPVNNRGVWRCNRDRWENEYEPWKCDKHKGTQYGCQREDQTMIVPPPTFAPTHNLDN